MTDRKITVENLKKNYGKKQVLKEISFYASQGECVCFTGRNGCGKTTLLSILAGLVKKTSGSIVAEGVEKTGYLPQVNPVLDRLSVKDNLWLWCSSKAEFWDIAVRFDLQDILKQKVGKLSGGMKRRLALAFAMTGNPQLIIMDEPTAALDIEYKALIHAEMKRYLGMGGIVIMVSHEKEEIDMADRVYRISDGIIKERNGG